MTELAQAIAKPDPKLAEPCKPPVDLAGYGALDAGQTERLWAADRDALAACGPRHAKALKFFSDRDAGLAGTPSHGDPR